MFSKTSQSGQFLILLIVVILIAGSFFFAGGLNYKKYAPPEGDSYATNACCDSGDGDACKPSDTKKFEWKGSNTAPEEYGLIKSNIQLLEGSGHLAPVNQGDVTPDGKKIFTNTTDTTASYCGQQGGGDSVFGGKPFTCLPNDQVIYVCVEGCDNAQSGTAANFDAYFRMSDGDVPEHIKNCAKTATPLAGEGLTAGTFKATAEADLQLHTLNFSSPGAAPWLSPYCKPAIYLYPEQTSFVVVRVDSDQPLVYTDPHYPAGGWKVVADSSGVISYLNKPYDYLYYETQVEDEKIEKPDEGFVVEKTKLPTLFATLLPRLGLNIKEAKQFSDYWQAALPSSNYYFVGIIPQDALSAYSTLDIFPKPSTEIRVTLYFEALDSEIEVSEPIIRTPVRHGFTVVEWGGIYKKHANETFSCFL